jgi:hypothetical protein
MEVSESAPAHKIFNQSFGKFYWIKEWRKSIKVKAIYIK